jgi:hypothetical protein
MRLSIKTKELLDKAKESCLLAVDIYNKPRTSFRSGGYVVLMSIAFTSLFHAIFEKNKIKYFYRIKDSLRYQRVDGDYKAWELGECTKEYFKNKPKEFLPIKKNVEFFIPLRNRIEHRFMPELDSEIFGECQALLHNFEFLLEHEFGIKHKIMEDLLFSLQFAQNYIKTKEVKKKPNKELEKIRAQIVSYRAGLEEEVYTSQRYSFKIYLLPKLVNNQNKADYAIEWINYDETKPEEMEKYKHLLGFIKEKARPIANYGLFKAGDVSKIVREKLSTLYKVKIKFSPSSHHVKCYKFYKVKPLRGENPEKTKEDFCVYDSAHGDHLYTQKWIDFLIEELSNKETFLKLFPNYRGVIK